MKVTSDPRLMEEHEMHKQLNENLARLARANAPLIPLVSEATGTLLEEDLKWIQDQKDRASAYIDTTYVERRVPTELEDEAHELIDNWLRAKGFDPEDL
jgi:hypothetical protein